MGNLRVDFGLCPPEARADDLSVALFFLLPPPSFRVKRVGLRGCLLELKTVPLYVQAPLTPRFEGSGRKSHATRERGRHDLPSNIVGFQVAA